MKLISKKIDIVHEIQFTIERKVYKMNTNFDVCRGDICEIRMGKKIEQTEIEQAIRLNEKTLIDPRVLKVYFKISSLDFDYKINSNQYIYKVKLINKDRKTEEALFVSDVLLNENNLVISDKNFGIIIEKVEVENCIVEEKIYAAYEVKLNEIKKIYCVGIVPRYLINEILERFTFTIPSDKIKQFNENEMRKKIIIEDDYNFDYEDNENMIFITNLARFNDYSSINFLLDFLDRNDKVEECEYWNNRNKKLTKRIDVI